MKNLSGWRKLCKRVAEILYHEPYFASGCDTTEISKRMCTKGRKKQVSVLSDVVSLNTCGKVLSKEKNEEMKFNDEKNFSSI